MTVTLVCVTPAGSGSSSAVAPHAQHARILKKTVTKLHRHKKAGH